MKLMEILSSTKTPFYTLSTYSNFEPPHHLKIFRSPKLGKVWGFSNYRFNTKFNRFLKCRKTFTYWKDRDYNNYYHRDDNYDNNYDNYYHRVVAIIIIESNNVNFHQDDTC